MRTKIYLIAGYIIGAFFSLDSTTQPRLYIVSLLNSLHQVNNNYSYDSLKHINTGLNPDIIAVDIRSDY